MRALSVVIAASRPWPEVRGALDSIYEQANAISAEIIVADGDGACLPDASTYPGIRWLRMPGATVFELRGRALKEAKGDVVAVTEDHCRAAPDWCSRVLEVHREDPDAAIIGGAVLNGATEHLIDWANFLAWNGRFLPPLPGGTREDVTGQANVSYKRWALRGYPDDGLLEGKFRRELLARGIRFRNDERPVVFHVQSLGPIGTCMIHYHDGRCVAAARASGELRRRWLRKLGRVLLWPIRVPAAAIYVLLRTLVGKPGYRWLTLKSAPWMFAVVAFHEAGELVGTLAGPGNSPTKMR